ncbi:hypothetical protein A6A07_00915 [Streptomyces sp. CB03911]|nr:hypothetical protein A6A07_00915 [Streptomyces sp. CB03911]
MPGPAPLRSVGGESTEARQYGDETWEPTMVTDQPVTPTSGPATATEAARDTGPGPGPEPRADGEPVPFAAAVVRGTALADLGDYDGAEAVLRRAIRVHEAAHGPDDPRLALPLRALAATRAARGGLAEAEQLSLRVLALVRSRAARPEPPGAAAAEGRRAPRQEDERRGER